MRLGKVRFESKCIAIQYFYEEKHWSIRWMFQQLDIIRAAYYKWLHRNIPDAEQENILIAQLIREYDNRFNQILGYRRMTLYINCLNNKHYSRNRIHRIMQSIKIPFVIRRNNIFGKISALLEDINAFMALYHRAVFEIRQEYAIEYGVILELGLISCGFNLHKYHLNKLAVQVAA